MRNPISCNQAKLRKAGRKADRTIRYFRNLCPRLSLSVEDLRAVLMIHCLRGIKVSALIEQLFLRKCGSSLAPHIRRKPIWVRHLDVVLHSMKARLEFYDKYYPNPVILRRKR